MSIKVQTHSSMEPLNSKCEFPLDQLPALIIENIAWYLSNKDLAACCAVSRGVREAFDDERVWKPRYNSDRVKYLLKTPCKVHPIFENPENSNNDLSPISQSRLAFMAENHLWNNWRQGKFSKELVSPKATMDDIFCGYKPFLNMFVTDDFVASLFSDRIETLDVRNSPASCALKPITLTNVMHSSVMRANDKIIVLLRTSVQVFFIDVSINQWILKHSFFIDETEILPDDRLSRADFDFFKSRQTCTFTVFDDFIIGVTWGGGTMHIWNFETGVKVKTESCPVEDAVIHQMLGTTSKDLILSVQQRENYDSSLLLAYSLPQLKFLAFRQGVQGTFSDLYDYMVFSNFILVWDDSKLNVYDYQNCQVKLEYYPCESSVLPQPLGNNIVFLVEGYLKLFNPVTSKLLTLEYKYRIIDFVVLFGRFIQVERHHHEGWDYTYDLLEIGDNFNVSMKASYALFFCGYKIFVNKPSTRCIFYSDLWHFW